PHCPAAPRAGGEPTPVATMAAPAMHQQQRRRLGVAPIDVMQPQPLREIDPRGWAGALQIGWRHRKPGLCGVANSVYTNIARPPRAPKRQAGVKFAKACFAPGYAIRAMSWTLPWVADAKGSATGNCPVVSCRLNTLLLR